MNSSEFKTMLSQRGNLLLICEKSKFRNFRELKTTQEIVWRCTRKNCTATVYTLNMVLSNKCGSHNHDLDEDTISRQIINNSVKRKAQEDISEKPSKLIRRELNNHKEIFDSITTRDVKCISNSINRARLKLLPKLPKSREEVQEILNSIEIKTIKDESFMLCNDISENIVIFSCKTNLDFMSKQQVLYMDGTFEYCTKIFVQLFSIHVFTNNMYVPVVFCLLKDKKKTTYIQMFRLLVEKCNLLGYTLKPDKIVIDFEVSIHISVKEVWPDVKLIGCRFHLAQAWWRKIQHLGLTKEYKNTESPVGRWLKHVFGLPFLPAEEVGNALVEDFISEKPIWNGIDEFLDYLVENFIDDEASFPPELWAANSASLARTTNACEAFHSKFKNENSSPHPNIHNFLKCLLEIQTEFICSNKFNK